MKQSIDQTKKSRHFNVSLHFWFTMFGVFLGVIVITGLILFLCGRDPFMMFEGFSGINGGWLIGAAVIIAGATAFIALGIKNTPKAGFSIKALLIGAMCVALSFVLSLIVLFKMPQGGSVTPASMLPIIIFAYIYGWKYGLGAGLILGLLQLFFDPFVIHPVQLMLDYLLAYALVGLAGVYRKHIWVSVIIGSAARLFCSVLSGVIFFSEYAGTQNAWLYSFGYNGLFMGIEAAICLVIIALPPIRKMIGMLKNHYGTPARTGSPRA